MSTPSEPAASIPAAEPTPGWIDEIHRGVRYGLTGRVLAEQQSELQRVTVIESERYGKGLLLDGCWMTAEAQERHYHEAIVHPALCGAARVERVLVIGGGDGGTARECLRHPEVRQLDLVEIDGLVVAWSQQYLGAIGGGAWSDPRLKLTVGDGIAWVREAAAASYDVVIVDGSDPAGPAEGLFNRAFFVHCRRILRPGGVFATQSESPEAFREIHIATVRLLREVFGHADPLYGWVPMYPSGWWSWTFAAVDGPRYREAQPQRAAAVAAGCEIWSPQWQRGGFTAVPAFVERALADPSDPAAAAAQPMAAAAEPAAEPGARFDTEGAIYMASRRDPAGCRVGLFGVPYDGTTSFRPGTRFGPTAIREVSSGLETYCPQLDLDLEALAFADLGAVAIPHGAPEPVVAAVEQATSAVLDLGLSPLMLGGEHSISSGAVAAVARRHPDLVLGQLDAHADLRDTWLGNRHNHACAMRRCLEVLPSATLLQIAIRSGTGMEFAELRGSGRLVAIERMAEALMPLRGRPLYLTVDLDWFDPAVLPGTGTPEPGGFHWREFALLVEELRHHRLVAADVVELAPQIDPTGVSAVLAAKVVRSLLLLLGRP